MKGNLMIYFILVNIVLDFCNDLIFKLKYVLEYLYLVVCV